jgi:hypothetical protein
MTLRQNESPVLSVDYETPGGMIHYPHEPFAGAAEAAPLPDDVATLKALLVAERATTAKLAGQNQHLRAIVKELHRALFGRRSEKAAIPISCSWPSRTSSCLQLCAQQATSTSRASPRPSRYAACPVETGRSMRIIGVRNLIDRAPISGRYCLGKLHPGNAG